MNESNPVRSSALVALAAGIVYGISLYPSVPPGDSGEIIAAVCSGGVIHPPGYPLYAMLAKPFSWLPLGSIAWRLNLFSAVAGAGAVFLIALAVAEWTRNSKAGLLAAGLFAFSPHVFRYAVAAEVFALNDLFVARRCFSRFGWIAAETCVMRESVR
jgi:hypothetical protein